MALANYAGAAHCRLAYTTLLLTYCVGYVRRWTSPTLATRAYLVLLRNRMLICTRLVVLLCLSPTRKTASTCLVDTCLHSMNAPHVWGDRPPRTGWRVH